MPYFEKKAAEGNQEMKDLVEEVKQRNMLDGLPPTNKKESKKFDDMW